MTAHRKKPFLAVVDGTALPPPVKAPRKAKRTPADREGTAISAAHTIEQLLPAYVELNRVWSIGTNKAHAYHDANVNSEDERYHRVPCAAAGDVEAIRELSGAHAAQRGMTALHSTMHTMARLIQVTPVSTMEGLRAKTLAAMWECIPGIADHVGFDFGDDEHPVEMLFRACVRVWRGSPVRRLSTDIVQRISWRQPRTGFAIGHTAEMLEALKVDYYAAYHGEKPLEPS